MILYMRGRICKTCLKPNDSELSRCHTCQVSALNLSVDLLGQGFGLGPGRKRGLGPRPRKVDRAEHWDRVTIKRTRKKPRD